MLVSEEGARNITADPGDAGAIPVDLTFCHVDIVTTGAETRTIADPTRSGNILTVNLKTDGGDCVITVASAINPTGNNTITLDDVQDGITLISVANGANFKWSVLGNHGATLTTV